MIFSSSILTAEEMRRHYGTFYSERPHVQLNSGNVPEGLWPLIPYAAFWGVRDEMTRDELLKKATDEIRQNLKWAVTAHEQALMAWLAGPEARNRTPSKEYIAFTTMMMASDTI